MVNIPFYTGKKYNRKIGEIKIKGNNSENVISENTMTVVIFFPSLPYTSSFHFTLTIYFLLFFFCVRMNTHTFILPLNFSHGSGFTNF